MDKIRDIVQWNSVRPSKEQNVDDRDMTGIDGRVKQTKPDVSVPFFEHTFVHRHTSLAVSQKWSWRMGKEFSLYIFLVVYYFRGSCITLIMKKLK